MDLYSHSEYQNGRQTEYSEIEIAMSDILLLRASEEATKREDHVNAKGDFTEEELMQHVKHLDGMVHHLLKTNVVVQGGIIANNEGGLACEEGQDTVGVFDGFHYFPDVNDSNRIRFDYFMHIAADTSSSALSLDTFKKMRQGPMYGTISASTLPARVSRDRTTLDFEKVSPSRAEAWLAVTHPDLFAALEQAASVPVEDDPYGEKSLLLLKNLKVNTFEEADDDYVFRSMLQRCVNVYLSSKMRFDTKKSYIVKTNGVHYLKNNGQILIMDSAMLPRAIDEMMITIEKLELFKQPDGLKDLTNDPHVPSLLATRAGRSLSQSESEIIIPIDSITAIRSERGLFFSALDVSRGLGKVRDE